MTKLFYLAAMALLGLGLTMAQNTTPASDSSNSSRPNQAQSSTANDSTTTSHSDSKVPARNHRQSDRTDQRVPNTTVQDQQSSTTSTTGASGQNNTTPSTSTMGTTGSTPDDEHPAPIRNGTSTDQQPNSSSSPTPTPHAMLNATPATRAMATHSPDPGTCMNPVALQTGAAPPPNPNCD
jgi:hypothetical protein